MQINTALRAIIVTAVATILSACNHRVEAAATPPPAQTLTAENKAKAAEVGRKLAAQDRAAEAAHRAQMDRLIDASIVQLRDSDRETTLLVHILNRSNKTISALDAGLEVHLVSNGKRVGLTEVHMSRVIPANGDVTFPVPLRYVRFGEDTASMRLAQGKAKHAEIEVTEIRYTDGTDAGYDD
jgi:hypothetical protein